MTFGNSQQGSFPSFSSGNPYAFLIQNAKKKGQDVSTTARPPIPYDPVLALLNSFNERKEGPGTTIKRLAEVASLGLGLAKEQFAATEPLVTSLYDRARQDLLSSYGGERQRVADTQRQLQSSLVQQLTQRRLGGTTLGAGLSSALEQQGLRQYQNIADLQGRSLANLAQGEAGARAQAKSLLGSFLERKSAVEQGIGNLKLQHVIARQNQDIASQNALFGGIGQAVGTLPSLAGLF